MRLITVLGNNGAGRRAILQAVAKQQGITGEDDLEELYSGKSSVKLKAPRYIRQAMIDVGLESVLAPVHVLTFAEPEQNYSATSHGKTLSLRLPWIQGLWSMFVLWMMFQDTDSVNHPVVAEARNSSWEMAD
jgi:hypothetical protein